MRPLLLSASLLVLACSSTEDTTKAPVTDAASDTGAAHETTAPECGKQTNFVGSCNRPMTNECDEYIGAGWTADTAKSGCSDFSTMPCTRTGLVGRCQVFCGSSNETVDYFYADAMGHMAKCTALGGTWVAE